MLDLDWVQGRLSPLLTAKTHRVAEQLTRRPRRKAEHERDDEYGDEYNNGGCKPKMKVL